MRVSLARDVRSYEPAKLTGLAATFCGASVAADQAGQAHHLGAQPCRGSVIARLSSQVPSVARIMFGMHSGSCLEAEELQQG